jgi:hypothetical protein
MTQQYSEGILRGAGGGTASPHPVARMIIFLGGPSCTMLACSPASSSNVSRNSKGKLKGADDGTLLEEAVERMVMGISHREREEKRRRRWRWKGADGCTTLF